MKLSSIIIVIFLLIALPLRSQEVLTGLSENPVIKHYLKQNPDLKSSIIEQPEPILLPFIETFKKTSVFPDQEKWMDRQVFINNDFALFPPTWNVATFDAIDQFGNLYPDANPILFRADALTSRPIRLDSVFSPQPKALSPADSVYLSFYFQPQGRANDPQPRDSLVLEFGHYTGKYLFSRIDSITVLAGIYGVDTIYPGDMLFSPCNPLLYIIARDTLYPNDPITLPCDSVFVPETRWYRVWSFPGMTLDTFLKKNNNQYFKQIFIPITDTIFFRKDFQFRFFNYASISNENLQSWQSNCDQWNIDLIVLDRGRSRLDSTHKILTFVGNAPSFLKNYQSMPFYQYSNDPTGVIKSQIEMFISNLDKGNQTATYFYEVRNDLGQFTFGYNGGSADLRPFNEAGYASNPSFATPQVPTFFPPFGNRDSIYFDITHYLQGDPLLGLADTLRFRQKFFNYYAYDDGTAEFGYGLTPAGAMLAYRFTLSRRDTLRAVQMYFNKTLTGANDRYFHLAVWNDLNGKPGNIIYLKENQRPKFSDLPYQYQTYYLDRPVPVQGSFYIGWIQQTSNNLNLGFDAANDASDYIFYNVTGNWVKTSFKGALMMRPVLGKPLTHHPSQPNTPYKKFVIYPNPTPDGQFSLRIVSENSSPDHQSFLIPEEEFARHVLLEIFTLTGQKVFESHLKEHLDLNQLQKGIYLMTITNLLTRSAEVHKIILMN